jgi:deazaflavin-dependent oxidoreductase (nitroreductase family)
LVPWLVLAAVAAASVGDDLRSVAEPSTVKLTTTGRTSGKPRVVTIWFVAEGERVWVQAGKDGGTDWYRNLGKTPEVGLDFGSLHLRGKARAIDDVAETDRVHGLFQQKYWMAWASSFLGGRFGGGKPVAIEALERQATSNR